LDSLEHDEKEVGIVRNNRPVARLVPEPRRMTAREALEGIYGVLSEEEGEDLLRAIELCDRPLATEMRDPWE
jgi:antitoxin (DNA-binding transcriptional repressor) of toxin-antitoxin stability system